MKATFTLYVTKYGHVRITRNPGGVKAGEKSFGVTVNIPDTIFIEPTRTITIDVPAPEPVDVQIEAWADDGGAVSVHDNEL